MCFLRTENVHYLLLHLTNLDRLSVFFFFFFCAFKLKFKCVFGKNTDGRRQLQACIFVSGMVFVPNI